MIDLKDLMDERSSGTPGFDHLRLASVRRRVTVRRRRRVIATAFAAVAILLFGGYALSPAVDARRPQPPLTSPSTDDVAAFPEYYSGGRVTTSAQASLKAGEVTLTWTPKTKKLMFWKRCSGLPAGAQATLEVFVNGTKVGGGGCEGLTTIDSLTPGMTTSLTVKIVKFELITQDASGTLAATPVPAPDGKIALAVLEPVDFDKYPLPARPPTLRPMPSASPCPNWPVKISSNPSDPAQPVSTTIVWQDMLAYSFKSQGPGQFQLSVDGRALLSFSVWDYEATGQSGPWGPGGNDPEGWSAPAPGTTVTVTVTPKHATAGWTIGLRPDKSQQVWLIAELC